MSLSEGIEEGLDVQYMGYVHAELPELGPSVFVEEVRVRI